MMAQQRAPDYTTYRSIDGSFGIVLKRKLPETMLESLNTSGSPDISKDVRLWSDRLKYLVHEVFRAPLSKYYIMLGYRQVHISSFPSYVENVLQTTAWSQGRRKPARSAPVRASIETTAILWWMYQNDAFYDFFNTIQTTFATQSIQDLYSMQSVQNLMMLAWQEAMQGIEFDNDTPWSWYSPIIMQTFFETLQEIRPDDCVIVTK